jgi:protein FRG1
MVTKLKFKGEKRKKRKRHDTETDVQGSARDGDDGSEGWVNAESIDDISSGPLFIAFASSLPVALAYRDTGNVFAPVIKSVGEDGDVHNAEPDDVPQVWLATRLAESDKISIKTPHNKFLSCDKVGLLSASKEAIGPQEEWRPIQTSNGWALQNVYDKFLYISLFRRELNC